MLVCINDHPRKGENWNDWKNAARKKKVTVTLWFSNTVVTLNKVFWRDVESIFFTFQFSACQPGSLLVYNYVFKRSLNRYLLKLWVKSTLRTLSKIMSSVAKIKLSFYIIDIELKWMTTETDENAVETRGVNECWHSSFEFHKLSRMLIFITEWKQ